MTERTANIITYVISILIIIGLIFLFSSCKTKTVYVPIESVKTEWRDKYLRDSIYLKDYVRIYQKGDTIFKDSIVYEYKYKFIKDSIFIHDSIPVPYAVPGETIYKNELKQWQEGLMYLGILCLGILGYRGYKFIKP